MAHPPVANAPVGAPAAPLAGEAPRAAPPGPADPATLVVDVRGVTKRFGPVPVLSDLDLVAPRGRITVLLGPNGAG